MAAPTPAFTLAPADAAADAPAVMELINAAYAVESGDSGVAFKNCLRFGGVGEVADVFRRSTVIKAVAADDAGMLLGVIAFHSVDGGGGMYFGPLAVAPAAQGRGVGRALIAHVEAAARAAGARYLQIVVINHRTDILPMYAAMGFTAVGTAPYTETHKLTRPSHFIMLTRPL
jgi:predicted N-acetyltransferase YhbS